MTYAMIAIICRIIEAGGGVPETEIGTQYSQGNESHLLYRVVQKECFRRSGVIESLGGHDDDEQSVKEDDHL